jgi:hypothetical protein
MVKMFTFIQEFTPYLQQTYSMYKKLPLLPLFAMLMLMACKGSPQPKDVTQKNGFYFWKTQWNFDDAHYSLLDTFQTQLIYMRIFDVGFDEEKKETYPLGVIDFQYTQYSPYEKYQVIPTIFITNSTFKNIQDNQLNDLANRVYKKIMSHFSQMGQMAVVSNSYSSESENQPYTERSKDFKELVVKDSLAKKYYNQVKEIQFDCDWTESTRDKYFTFLKYIQQKLNDKIVSSTIRLYQYKYPEKAGIPPVKKGMLMCYNVGDVRQANGPNSIFDKKEVLKYFTRKEAYPLPLDYAFPIFGWGAVYRNNQLIKLLPVESFYINENYQIISTPHEVTKYKILDDTQLYSEDFTLLKNDVVKIESVNYQEVVSVAKKVSSLNTNPTPHIVLFDFEIENVRKNAPAIQKIFNCF